MGVQDDAKLVAATSQAGKLQNESVKAKALSDRAWYTKAWAFITRPKTLWNKARDPKRDGGAMGVFGALQHALWPSSTGGKVACAVGAATVAAGVVGGFKYAEHREDKRKSDSRKKWGLAAACVAATGVAALGLYKGYEAYQTQQEPDEYLAEAGELQTPEKENSQAVGAGSSTKKSGKT